MRAVWKRWKYSVLLFLAGLSGCDVVTTEHRSLGSESAQPVVAGSPTGGGRGAVAATPGNADSGAASAAGRGVAGRTGSGTLTGK